MTSFEEFPKIARLNRECVITEKIDGDNAQIFITDLHDDGDPDADSPLAYVDGLHIFAGSRTRWVYPLADNHGFAKWVLANAEELVKLGVGRHAGEWWGSGIRRGYGLVGGHKEFSLFNTHKWTDDTVRPKCCNVVPVLYQGLFSTEVVGTQIERLRTLGSVASPGFKRPEGVVIWHTHASTYFKATLENDELPKSLVKDVA